MEVQVRHGYLDRHLFMSTCNSVGMYMNYICMSRTVCCRYCWRWIRSDLRRRPPSLPREDVPNEHQLSPFL